MSIVIKGVIKLIKETETFDSGFYKRQIVVTEDGQYPNDIPIDFFKDKSDILDNFGIGQEVNVSVNIRGSEYNGKYYVSLNGWRIEKSNSNSNYSAPPVPESAVDNYMNKNNDFNEDEQDDLPF
jgi:hypothetical protein